MSEKQRIKFEEIRAGNYEVSKAWQAREDFKASFSNATPEESAEIFANWEKSVKESGLAEVIKVGLIQSKKF